MWRLILAALLVVSAAVTAHAQIHRFEAETGQLIDVVGSAPLRIANSTSGYSGTGYVTNFFDSGDRFQLQASIPQGLYELWVGYRSPFGEKGYTYHVNSETGTGMLDMSTSWAADRAGLFSIPNGTTTFGIEKNWGWHDVDYLEFRPFTPPSVLPLTTELSDAHAGPRTQWLMNYLVSQYGEKTFSGQQHSVSDNLPWPGNTYLSKSGGMIPAIRGSDLIDYSPSRRQFGENPNNESEQTIQWAQQTGGLVTMMWHWNAPADLVNAGDWPWWRGFYTQGTTFDLPTALANPQSEDYQFILRDIDAIAVELQKFQSANVPVIWRPLHEAQGGWFWWGAHGPETFKDLWNLMHDRMTNVHGLHNLIWEYTSTGVNDEFLNWYPGDDVVDMIGADIYTDPSSSMSGEWYDLLEIFNGRKMIALSETGTLPNPDLLDLWNINWSYFSPWNGTFVDAFTPAALQAILGDEDVITLDELLATPWKQSGGFLGGDLNFDGTVTAADLTIWQDAYGQTAAGDVDLDGDADGRDFLLWQRQYSGAVGLTNSIVVPEPTSCAIALLLIAAGGRRRLPIRNAPKSATAARHRIQANRDAIRTRVRCSAA